MENTHTRLDYDARLANAVRDGGEGARRAAVTLFERHNPASLTAAVDLVAPYGPVPPDLFDHISCAYDIYRHTRDMPSD